MSKNILVFEGAGWHKSESAGDVGNCRIRTRIRNNNGRLIYLEMGGTKIDKKYSPKQYYKYDIMAHVDFVFYDDAEWDKRDNYSPEFAKIINTRFEYNKENILNYVNNNLNCSFTDLIVINDNSVRVHNTSEPLCDCSNGNYEPYREEKITKSELEGINPIGKYYNNNFAKYRLSWNSVRKIQCVQNWLNQQHKSEKYKNYNFYAHFRFNNSGEIIDLSVSALEGDFPHFSMTKADVKFIIGLLKNDKLNQVA